MLSSVEAWVLCSLMSIVKAMRAVQAQSARVLWLKKIRKGEDRKSTDSQPAGYGKESHMRWNAWNNRSVLLQPADCYAITCEDISAIRMCLCGAYIELLACMQNALLQHQLGQLLKYASSLAREKNVLVQRTMELTERWNQVTVRSIVHVFSMWCFAYVHYKEQTSVPNLLCDQLQDQLLDVNLWCHLILLWSTNVRDKGPDR